MNPKLFVITGPTGAGIPELVGNLLKNRDNLVTVTPVTARKMKEGEQDGLGFFFYDLDIKVVKIDFLDKENMLYSQ